MTTSPRPTSDARNEAADKTLAGPDLAIAIAAHDLPDGTHEQRRDLSLAIINAIGICEKEVAGVVLNVAREVYTQQQADLVTALKSIAERCDQIVSGRDAHVVQVEELAVLARAALAKAGAQS